VLIFKLTNYTAPFLA